MHLFLNALAATNLSSRKVLNGWIEGFVKMAEPSFRVTVLASDSDRPVRLPGVQFISTPTVARHWSARRMWEMVMLPSLVRATCADAVLHFSGMPVPRVSVPQIAFLHNPLPFLEVASELRGRGKRQLQALAIKRHLPRAAAFFTPSEYMLSCIHDSIPESRTIPSAVIHHGLTLADQNLRRVIGSRSNLITVSNWAPHKNLEALIMAVALLENDVTLHVIGPWACSRYKRRIRRVIATLGLKNRIEIHGYLPRSDVMEHVSRARAFCLMSRSESFGLPALEAQAIGTPVIVAAETAMPEVCGNVAIVVPPADVAALTRAVSAILTNDKEWVRSSEASIQNALWYSWDEAAGRIIDLAERMVLASTAAQ